MSEKNDDVYDLMVDDETGDLRPKVDKVSVWYLLSRRMYSTNSYIHAHTHIDLETNFWKLWQGDFTNEFN